jgi:hypothetical protein
MTLFIVTKIFKTYKNVLNTKPTILIFFILKTCFLSKRHKRKKKLFGACEWLVMLFIIIVVLDAISERIIIENKNHK